jgi:hypothetical protein
MPGQTYCIVVPISFDSIHSNSQINHDFWTFKGKLDEITNSKLDQIRWNGQRYFFRHTFFYSTKNKKHTTCLQAQVSNSKIHILLGYNLMCLEYEIPMFQFLWMKSTFSCLSLQFPLVSLRLSWNRKCPTLGPTGSLEYHQINFIWKYMKPRSDLITPLFHMLLIEW